MQLTLSSTTIGTNFTTKVTGRGNSKVTDRRHFQFYQNQIVINWLWSHSHSLRAWSRLLCPKTLR